MLRPENTHPGDNSDVLRDADVLETAENGALSNYSDSPTSAADAGLIDESGDFDRTLDSDFDLGEGPREIPMTDAFSDEKPELHMPELSDMDAPGEIDIEELDEDAVRALLPEDARLDPLEP